MVGFHVVHGVEEVNGHGTLRESSSQHSEFFERAAIHQEDF
jgi:hypothetical protein